MSFILKGDGNVQGDSSKDEVNDQLSSIRNRIDNLTIENVILREENGRIREENGRPGRTFRRRIWRDSYRNPTRFTEDFIEGYRIP